MNSLVVGMGELGQAVKKVTVSEYSYDPAFDKKLPKVKSVDVLHICFPYSENFIADVQHYIYLKQPTHIVIWSTVPIGTCRKIDPRIVHSPVEGKHPDLAKSICHMTRWIGYNRGEEGRFFEDYFKKWSLRVALVPKTEVTELLKLRSTAKYGVNLVWAEYESQLCEKFGVSYGAIMAFDEDYNKMYRYLDEDEMQRYVLFPPNGEIGGHCVVPNAKLLNEQFPSDLLDKIIAMEKE